MGLTIHYHLESKTRSPQRARALVAKLRQRALDLPLEQVGELVELEGASCNYENVGRDDPNRWLLIQARQSVDMGKHDDRQYSQDVLPIQLIAFSTLPGEGCEEANFGLCCYPTTVTVPDRNLPGQTRTVRTGLGGWRWSSFCKTQYASNPAAGGVANFLRCHLSVIALLDEARKLGFLSSVNDEGGFWEKRDVRVLAEVVGQWNEQIAGLAGQLMDRLGPDLVAEITNFPNFEHLEAKGRDKA